MPLHISEACSTSLSLVLAKATSSPSICCALALLRPSRSNWPPIKPFWDRILLPIALGVLGPALGVVPVHSACLAIDGAGLLIAGASGAGKSTLSVALAQEGFDFISDDWTYLSLNHGKAGCPRHVDTGKVAS